MFDQLEPLVFVEATKAANVDAVAELGLPSRAVPKIAAALTANLKAWKLETKPNPEEGTSPRHQSMVCGGAGLCLQRLVQNMTFLSINRLSYSG